MHVDCIVVREAERMKGWLRGGRRCTSSHKADKYEFASEMKLGCSLKAMTLFILITMEGRNETT